MNEHGDSVSGRIEAPLPGPRFALSRWIVCATVGLVGLGGCELAPSDGRNARVG